jgi:hypothetical protein
MKTCLVKIWENILPSARPRITVATLVALGPGDGNVCAVSVLVRVPRRLSRALTMTARRIRRDLARPGVMQWNSTAV